MLLAWEPKDAGAPPWERRARLPWPSGAQVSYVAGLLTIVTLGIALAGGIGFATRRRR